MGELKDGDLLQVAGHEYLVRIAASTGRKATARVRGAQIFVRVPSAAEPNLRRTMLSELEAKLQTMLSDGPPAQKGMQPLQFTDGQVVEVLGVKYAVAVAQGVGTESRGTWYRDWIRVELAAGLTAAERTEHTGALVRRLITARALPIVTKRVRELNDLHFGATIRRVILRDQYSRWGSCSAAGTISLNFRLLFAPPSVLDAIIVHELAHTRHMNHSPQFWAVVRQAMPDYDAAERWLVANAARLGVQRPDDIEG
ncbi:MAG: M48 family metallopeptidase [Armatimonadetes bacterium]|nr:M48 family metallopeptidase [Armatimonadota bacterium]